MNDSLLTLLDLIDRRLRGPLWGKRDPFVSAHGTPGDPAVWTVYIETGSRWCMFCLDTEHSVASTEQSMAGLAAHVERALRDNHNGVLGLTGARQETA